VIDANLRPNIKVDSMTSPIVASSKGPTVILPPKVATPARTRLLTSALGVAASALVLLLSGPLSVASAAENSGLNTAPHAAPSDATGTLQLQRESGYYPEADAPLYPPYVPLPGAASTLEKQRQSGYYAEAGAPLYPPYAPLPSAASTLEKQRQSGYYAEAGAPLYPPYVPLRGTAGTLEKQRQSGYFPEAGSPDINTTLR
jgi:hypothetical protein